MSRSLPAELIPQSMQEAVKCWPADPPPELCVVERDTREQLPWDLSPLTMVTATRQTADYGLRDFPTVAIDRKSAEDWIGTLGDRARWDREVERLQGFPIRAVIIEADWSFFEAHRWRGKMTPAQIFGSTCGYMAAGINIVLAGNRERAQQIAAKVLYIEFRRQWRRLREAAASIAASEGVRAE